MKAILINADERKITAVDAGDPNQSLERLRELIGCEWVQPVVIGENLTLWLAPGEVTPPGRPDIYFNMTASGFVAEVVDYRNPLPRRSFRGRLAEKIIIVLAAPIKLE